MQRPHSSAWFWIDPDGRGPGALFAAGETIVRHRRAVVAPAWIDGNAGALRVAGAAWSAGIDRFFRLLDCAHVVDSGPPVNDEVLILELDDAACRVVLTFEGAPGIVNQGGDVLARGLLWPNSHHLDPCDTQPFVGWVVKLALAEMVESLGPDSSRSPGRAAGLLLEITHGPYRVGALIC